LENWSEDFTQRRKNRKAAKNTGDEQQPKPNEINSNKKSLSIQKPLFFSSLRLGVLRAFA
jgi:hypothetical protein